MKCTCTHGVTSCCVRTFTFSDVKEPLGSHRWLLFTVLYMLQSVVTTCNLVTTCTCHVLLRSVFISDYICLSNF